MDNEKINNTVVSDDAAIEQDWQNSIVPKIHNIGQSTMLIGFILMFLPGLFMYFVCGWNEIPFSSVVAFIVFWIPMSGISQLTEHLRFYPMMGSAATYIGYLAGNATGMRLPVAQSCASAFDHEVLSAKGQVAAIVGVAVSVVANIVVLLLIIFFGNAILSILPDVVRSALGFITYAIFGYLLAMNLRGVGGGNVFKGFGNSWLWLVFALIVRYLFKIKLGSSLYMVWCLLAAFAVAFAVEFFKDKKTA